MPEPVNTSTLRSRVRELRRIRAAMIRMETTFAGDLKAVHPVHRQGARNLLHYLALPRPETPHPGEMIGIPGLCSLAGGGTSVLSGIEAILEILEKEGDLGFGVPEGRALLEKQTRALLGPKPEGRRTRIMVTAPAEAAVDPAFALDLVKRGMDVMRINCARDDASTWLAMIKNLKRAERKAARSCRVFMDLAGPKLRTGPIRVGRAGAGSPPGSFRLRKGDRLLLTRNADPGGPAVVDGDGVVISQASIGVTFPRVLEDVRPGEPLWIDDGKIGGVIRRVTKAGVEVEITRVRERGRRLRADRGINLPGSHLHLPSVTEKDAKDLRFIAANADMVGLSFVRDVENINDARSLVADYGGEALGLVVKIENRRAWEQLPALLLAGMKSKRVGVLIARGDLAVECGFDRIADLQEEILGMCKAAHVPVIWATQVLEDLTQEGLATRPEMTDAAAARRAECVLLNKGPYIGEALETLDALLRGPRYPRRRKAMGSTIPAILKRQSGSKNLKGKAPL